MTRQEGYATLFVTGLLAGLAIIAMAWLNLSLTAAREAGRQADRLRLDLLAEGRLNLALADMLNTETSLTPSGRQVSDGDWRIHTRSLKDRVDINRDDPDQISNALEMALTDAGQAEAVAGHIKSLRLQSPTPVLGSLDELVTGDLPASALACLDRHLTVFHDPAPPPRRGRPQMAADGGLVRVRIEPRNGEPGGRLDATILLTGRRDTPFWIMDWRHHSPPKDTCHAPL